MLKVEAIDIYYGDSRRLKEFPSNWGKTRLYPWWAPMGGKTTTLNAISGIHRLRSGSIHFGEINIGRRGSHQIVELGIIQVPEGRMLFPK